MNAPHLLILGAGSVGKRHLKNFTDLGCLVSAMDPRPDRLEDAGPLQKAYSDLDGALADARNFAGVVVCSPPKFHVEQGLAALSRKLPVFLEKPVSPDAASAQALAAEAARSRIPCLLGYTWRWWPAIRDLKARIAREDAGRILHVRCTLSAHLADWHPWERYQDFFMASKEMGGGALLDESHFIDLMIWFFGLPDEVEGSVERLSSLEIDTDDNVDAVLRYRGGLRTVLHLDLYGRPHDRSIIVSGDAGTLQWTFEPNRVRFGKETGQSWSEVEYGEPRNHMFVKAAEEFLQVIRGECKPSCTLEDGYRALRVVEAIRKSSVSGRRVSLSECP